MCVFFRVNLLFAVLSPFNNMSCFLYAQSYQLLSLHFSPHVFFSSLLRRKEGQNAVFSL